MSFTYRSRPCFVKAAQWTGDNYDEVAAALSFHEDFDNVTRVGTSLFIHTPEGVMEVSEGDYIIRRFASGELRTCKPDIFERTYDPAVPSEELRRREKAEQAKIEQLARSIDEACFITAFAAGELKRLAGMTEGLRQQFGDGNHAHRKAMKELRPIPFRVIEKGSIEITAVYGRCNGDTALLQVETSGRSCDLPSAGVGDDGLQFSITEAAPTTISSIVIPDFVGWDVWSMDNTSGCIALALYVP